MKTIYHFTSPHIEASGNTKEKCIENARRWAEDGWDVWSGVCKCGKDENIIYKADLWRYFDLSEEEKTQVAGRSDENYENVKIY